MSAPNNAANNNTATTINTANNDQTITIWGRPVQVNANFAALPPVVRLHRTNALFRMFNSVGSSLLRIDLADDGSLSVIATSHPFFMPASASGTAIAAVNGVLAPNNPQPANNNNGPGNNNAPAAILNAPAAVINAPAPILNAPAPNNNNNNNNNNNINALFANINNAAVPPNVDRNRRPTPLASRESVPGRRFYCALCPRSFTARRDLRRHYKLQHGRPNVDVRGVAPR